MLNFVGDLGYLMIVFSFVGFLTSSGNLLMFILLCEFVWVSFYYLMIFIGVSYDSLLLVLYCMYLLCIATGESGVSLNLLMMQFKSKENLDSVGEKNIKGKQNKKYENMKK